MFMVMIWPLLEVVVYFVQVQFGFLIPLVGSVCWSKHLDVWHAFGSYKVLI